MLRDNAWPGVSLVGKGAELEEARALFARLASCAAWLLLDGDALPGWRALLETGAAQAGTVPLRVDLQPLAGLEESRVEDVAIRLARLARISDRPLAFDADGLGDDPELTRNLTEFFSTFEACHCRGAVLAPDPARLAQRLGAAPYRIEHLVNGSAMRFAAFRAAAAGAAATFTAEAAESLINLFPLEIDGFEQAMRIALAGALPTGDPTQAGRERFIAACKDVAAVGASGLAHRIEPSFSLDDLVLPQDRKDQLREIVSNISFAPKVLDGWKFRDQLPYGLGVTALLHGPSGTGKTMAALAVANALGVSVLKIDLSRLVSKYIGETEKNIDRIFVEAQHSGAALLIDEADGLLSRRGEVKDANDRSANIEVAYLLQRMEAHEGLVILTTNLRQNIDSAFLRRLRFVIDFPRPDAAAREAIWRYCLPADSFDLTDADFKLLARRVELTGGSIRQITLRAAFIAAAAKPAKLIGITEIAQATRAEYAKLGVPPVDVNPPAQERRAA
jgi:AAA+ superfamily predicted ATPase